MPTENGKIDDSFFGDINGYTRKMRSLKKISDWKRVRYWDIDPDYWKIANSSKYEWGIIEKGGTIYSVLLDRIGEPDISIKVDDGEIISLDRGEFGAEIYWISSDHKNPTLISNNHIHSFINTPVGILGMGGLTHMMTNEGQIEKFVKKDNQWVCETIFEFHDDCPRAWCLHDDILWVVTDSCILTLSIKDFKVGLFFTKGFWEVLFPNSIAIGSDNTVFIGMRGGIVEVKSSFMINWLVENDEECNHIENKTHYPANYIKNLITKGKLLAELGRHDKAPAVYLKVLEIEPNNLEALINTGNSLIALKSYPTSLLCYDRVLQIDSNNSLAWYRKGLILDRIGQHDKAILCYDKCLAIEDADLYFKVLWRKGLTLDKLGRKAEAHSCFEQVEMAYSGHPTIYDPTGDSGGQGQEEIINLCGENEEDLETVPDNAIEYQESVDDDETDEEYYERLERGFEDLGDYDIMQYYHTCQKSDDDYEPDY